MFLHNLPKERIKDYLDLAYTLISVDGNVTEDELENFSMYAIELHLDKIPECETVNYDDTLDKFADLPKVIKKEIYFELLSLAYADTNYDVKEKELINKVQSKFEIPTEIAEKIESIMISILAKYSELGGIINE